MVTNQPKWKNGKRKGEKYVSNSNFNPSNSAKKDLIFLGQTITIVRQAKKKINCGNVKAI